MEDQFVVPQFIDNEDQILGPITARQFLILLAVLLIEAILYAILRFVPFLLVGVPLLIAGGVVAFLKINEQPFHFFLLNIVQTFRRPQLRVWNKTKIDTELRELLKVVQEPAPIVFTRKATLSTSRLEELTLIVNTGGSYRPEGIDT